MDIDPPPMNNIQVMLEPQEDLGCDVQIDHENKVSNGVDDYIFVSDKEHRSTKPKKKIRV